jgi:1-acyl-sn-glycerol-3-phosphate acyltransferase
MNSPTETNKLFNHLGQQIAYFYARRLMRSEIEWEIPIPVGPKVIAANHPTTTDPFLMMAWPLEPVYILITEEAFKVPLVGQFLRAAGHIPVYANRGREAFEAGLRLLHSGHAVGIFPEGALSAENGHLMPARSGAVRLAAAAGVPLIPIGIALDKHFVTRRQLHQLGIEESMRWFWLGAYEVSAGKPLNVEHAADDFEAVKISTDKLMQAIKCLMEHSARRLLNASWPLNFELEDLST